MNHMLEFFSKNFRTSIIKCFSKQILWKKKKGKFQQRHISARKNQMAITELKNTRNKIKHPMDGLSSGDDKRVESVHLRLDQYNLSKLNNREKLRTPSKKKKKTKRASGFCGTVTNDPTFISSHPRRTGETQQS